MGETNQELGCNTKLDTLRIVLLEEGAKWECLSLGHRLTGADTSRCVSMAIISLFLTAAMQSRLVLLLPLLQVEV